MKLFNCLIEFFKPKNELQAFIERHNPQSVYEVEQLQRKFDRLVVLQFHLK